LAVSTLAEVYPITVNPEHQMLTDLGVFTAACGIMAYEGGLFPAPFDSVVFVAEPVANLVHADFVRESGATFTASRVYEQKEFLASRDPWFRPVNHYTGPDGAVYVVDYYRRVVEHPEWMAEGAAESQDLYEGIDKGRIYRVTPVGTPAADWTKDFAFGDASVSELVGKLGHENSWHRRNAQRLLVDRNDKNSVPLLREALRSANEVARLHAAWTLEGLGALEEGDVVRLLEDSVAGVRENGILLAEDYLDSEAVLAALFGLQEDDNGRVRFQLLCTLGEVDSPEARQARQALLFAGLNDSWMQYAALSARFPDYGGLLNTAISKFDTNNPAYAGLIERVAAMSVASASLEDIKALLGRALNPGGGSNGAWQAALLRGLSQQDGEYVTSSSLETERKQLVQALYEHPHESVRAASLVTLQRIGLPSDESIQPVLQRSVALMGDGNVEPPLRIRAMEFVALASPEVVSDKLPPLLAPGENPNVQRAAVRILGRHGGTEITDWLIGRWASLGPAVREETIEILFAGEDRVRQLIEALEAGIIDPSAVVWGRQVGLMAQRNDELRRRARQIFAVESGDAEKTATLETYRSALDESGDTKKGALLYEAHCSACHQIGGGYGVAYGPDLAAIRNRKPETVLKDILEPNASIADGYDLWEITMTDGAVKRGIIASETPTSITLSVYNQADEVISRQDIVSLTSMAMSLMPAGLEHQITPQEMNDLLTFVKKLN